MKDMMASPPKSSRASRKSSKSRPIRNGISESTTGSISSESSQSETEFVGLLDPPHKSRFTSGNFLKASKIIRSIKNPNPREDRPVFWSDEERILTYELTVAILKYSSFLKEALEKSSIYVKHPQLQHVAQEELLVILYDLLERDFRTSMEDTPLPEVFQKLQRAILDSKTKLMAHIAKLRIKHEAQTLENLLPTNLRHQHNIDKNPLYFWINFKKVSEMPKVVAALRHHGLQETRFEDDTLIQTQLFSVSRLHPDLIRMNSSKANAITAMPIFRDGLIVVQDKSACLPVYVLAKALYYKEAIYHRGAGLEKLNPFPNGDPFQKSKSPPPEPSSTSTEASSLVEEWYQGILEAPGKHFVKPETVVVTHCGHGRSPAHLAILLAEAVPRYLSRSVNMSTTGSDLVKAIKSKFIYRPPLNVIVFGTPVNKHEEISRYIKKTLGVTNIRLYSEDFMNISPKDSRLKRCGAILVNPPSSGSALKDPVSFICSEGGDEQILTQFSKFMSSATTTMRDDNGNSTKYSPNQAKYLNHALSFPNVKLVLYTTCSNLPCENSEVVKVCLNEARLREETKKCQVYASIVMQSQSKSYRDVSYEIVNLDKLMEGYEKESCLNGYFVDMYPSSACSGVFMSLIRRRDRYVNMAKNPVKQFVASQMKMKGSNISDKSFSEDGQISPPDTSGTASVSNFSSAGSFTEEELARYLMRKLNLVDGAANNDLMISPTIPIFQASAKKKASKKAIVKRVSTPTHSSLQRQTEKFYFAGGSSTPNSGTQTPRSGTRTPDKLGSRLGLQQQPGVVVTTTPCPHHHLHQAGHVCVCARHAKKFPELLKNI